MQTTVLTAVQILVLLNPFAVLSTFLALTPNWKEPARRQLVLRAMVAVVLASILLFFGGNVIFSLFGIDINVFRVGGGVILMVCAVSLIWGKSSEQPTEEDPNQDIAVVPVAIPMAVGPGTAAGLILIGLESKTPLAITSALISLIVAIGLLGGLLFVATKAERLLGKRGIAIITKLTGLFLSAIAASMILGGTKNFFA